MKKKNLFDLLALKETVSSNKYIQKLKPLKEEKIKIINILEQLNLFEPQQQLIKDWTEKNDTYLETIRELVIIGIRQKLKEKD